MSRRPTPTDRQGALRRSFEVCRPHLRGQRAIAGGGLAAMIVEVAMRLLEPWPVRAVVDAVAPTSVSAGVRPGISRLLIMAAVATLAVVAVRAVAAYVSTVLFALAGSRVTTRLRHRVYEHTLSLSMRFHDRSRPGDLIVRLTGDIQRVQDVAVGAALPLLGNVFLFVGMSVVMVVIDPVLALSVLAVTPLFLLTSARSGTKITAASRRQRSNEGALATTAGESLGAMRLVHSYGLTDMLTREFERGNESSLRSGVAARRLSAGLERRTDVIVGVASAVVLFVGGRRVLDGAITTGELVVFLSYLKAAFKPMRDLAKYTGRIARAAASGERIADLLAEKPEIADKSHARPLGRVHGDIELRDVAVEYRAGRTVLEDVNLHIRPGERVALVGESGAGKSTLVAVIQRLVEPSRGAVLLDGHDIRNVMLESVRASMAVVLQESVLFAVSIGENIRCGRLEATDDDVVAAARAADAHQFIEALPDGYDTVVGQRGATLSGGQRQRIAIARAILRDAPIVILDEPTTGLDPVSAHEVLGALERLTEGRTTIVIAHDPDLTADCRVVRVTDWSVRTRDVPAGAMP